MKKLMLIAKQSDVLQLYLTALKSIFNGYLEILGHITGEEDDEKQAHSKLLQADMVVITNPYSFPYARKHMKEHSKIINLNFTFEKTYIDKLRVLPTGTNALVCFNFYSSSHQAANELYELGLENLNLYIYYPGNPNLLDKKMDFALISSYAREIPPGINKVIDLGPRRIGFSTILEIAMHFDILDDVLEKKIYDYCQTSGNPSGFLSSFYDSSTIAKHQLTAITNCIDDAIIIFDSNNQILSHNYNLNKMFQFKGNISGNFLNKLPWFQKISKLLSQEKDIKNKLVYVEIIEKNLLVSKEIINKHNSHSPVYITLLKDVTDFMKLENSLRKQLSKKGHLAKYSFCDIKGISPQIKDCIRKAERIAIVDKPTLIIGESGTGKELFAQSIHNSSKRKTFPFIGINCAALPSELLESELFGYEEGAFTGAKKGGKQGLFQLADKGTLFLDEIGEMSLTTQAKILRVLEEHEVMKIGSGEIIAVDVRVVAATNRNLKNLIEEGKFRLDLYYRLNTLIIKIPPLRERSGDIRLLIDSILKSENFHDIKIDPQLMAFLEDYEWKGNIRELKNSVEFMIYTSDGELTMSDLPEYILDNIESPYLLKEKTLPLQLSRPTEDEEIYSIILTILSENKLGRRQLLKILNNQGIKISEYKLRNHLAMLEGKTFITFGKGSSGATITNQGISYLKK